MPAGDDPLVASMDHASRLSVYRSCRHLGPAIAKQLLITIADRGDPNGARRPCPLRSARGRHWCARWSYAHRRVREMGQPISALRGYVRVMSAAHNENRLTAQIRAFGVAQRQHGPQQYSTGKNFRARTLWRQRYWPHWSSPGRSDGACRLCTCPRPQRENRPIQRRPAQHRLHPGDWLPIAEKNGACRFPPPDPWDSERGQDRITFAPIQSDRAHRRRCRAAPRCYPPSPCAVGPAACRCLKGVDRKGGKRRAISGRVSWVT